MMKKDKTDEHKRSRKNKNAQTGGNGERQQTLKM